MRTFKDGTTYDNPAMWIDSRGVLWKGPMNPDNTLHFAKFCGFNHLTKPIWVLQSSECPWDCKQVIIEANKP